MSERSSRFRISWLFWSICCIADREKLKNKISSPGFNEWDVAAAFSRATVVLPDPGPPVTRTWPSCCRIAFRLSQSVLVLTFLPPHHLRPPVWDRQVLPLRGPLQVSGRALALGTCVSLAGCRGLLPEARRRRKAPWRRWA